MARGGRRRAPLRLASALLLLGFLFCPAAAELSIRFTSPEDGSTVWIADDRPVHIAFDVAGVSFPIAGHVGPSLALLIPLSLILFPRSGLLYKYPAPVLVFRARTANKQLQTVTFWFHCGLFGGCDEFGLRAWTSCSVKSFEPRPQ